MSSYAFHDTISGSVTHSIGSEAMSLDGEYIENHIAGYRTLSVSGRESLEYDISDDDRRSDGQNYYYKRLPARILTIRFQLIAADAESFMAQFRELKNFCKGESRVIRFADEPNAHYTGTLEKLEAPDPGLLSITTTMTFYCADPYLVADEITTVTAARVNGVLTAEVNNDSSGRIYPTYRIRHSKENGYIGIVSDQGVLELGNRDEMDGHTYETSETLVSGFADWEDYAGKNPVSDVAVTSGVLTRDNGEQDWLWNRANPSQFACKRIKLPADSKGVVGATNFYLWWESQFETGLMGQTGLQQIALTDADDQLIAAFSLFKSDSTGNGAYVFFYGPKERYKLFIFTPDYHNNFSSRQRRGYEDILKTGDKLRFYYDGRYYETTISGLADKAVTYLYVTIGDWGERTKATDHVTVNGVGRIAGVKLNVQNWKDDPNRYKAGSEIVIDTENDAITVDGLPRNDELVTGSEFFALPPGKTKVEFYASGWCKADPTISVEYRKRWL